MRIYLKKMIALVLVVLIGGMVLSCAEETTQSSTDYVVPAEKITIQGIGIVNKTLTMVKDDQKFLNATVSPSDASNKDIEWSSNDTAVATVDSTGKIIAVGLGNCVISTTNGEVSETLTIVVIAEVELTEIAFEQSEVSVNIGNEKQLIIIYTPTNANDVTLYYSIAPVGGANADLATVSAAGLVSISSDALADSQYLVTAMVLTNTSVYAQCTLTINEVQLTDLHLKKNNEALALNTGETNRLNIPINLVSNVFAFIPIYAPTNTTQIDVAFVSSDENVLTVNEHGIYTVAASAQVGDTCEITVQGSNSISSIVYIEITEATNYVYQLYNSDYFNNLATDYRNEWDIAEYATDGMTTDPGDDYYDTAGNKPTTQALWRGGKTTSTYGGVAPWDGVWGIICDSWDHPYNDDEVANQYMFNKVSIGSEVNILKMRVRSHITQFTSYRGKFRVGVITVDEFGNYTQQPYLSLVSGITIDTEDSWMIISNSTVADYEAGNDYYYFDISAYNGQTVIITFEVDDMHDNDLLLGEMDSMLCDRICWLGTWLIQDMSEED